MDRASLFMLFGHVWLAAGVTAVEGLPAALCSLLGLAWLSVGFYLAVQL